MISRAQFTTVAWLRWRAFRNGLRSRRGKAEAFSGIFMLILMLMFGFGPSIGYAFGSYYAISHHEPRMLAIFFWITFFYWQLVPTIAISVSDVFDTTSFLRFPVSLSTYYALWLAFGSLDPALIVPTLWLFGIFCGVAFANPLLIPWTLLVLAAFAVSNLILSRMIIAYVERWMAKRKTREIVGALLAFSGVGFQLIIRGVERVAPHNLNSPLYLTLTSLQQSLPPGAAANSLTSGLPHSLGYFAILCAYIAVFGVILAFRLSGQYRGENFSEAAAKTKVEKRPIERHRGWLALPDPVGAVFEKEVRTLAGTQQIWLVLLSPFIMLLIFGTIGSGHNNSFTRSHWTLPLGAAYGLLSLSSYFCNSFSGEQGGIQFLYLAPVRFREIMIGKNLAHGLLASLQFLLFAVALSFFAPPSPAMFALTLAAMTFAVFANLCAGNLLSFYFPRKVDFSRLNQKGSSATGLFMLGIQIATIAVATPIFLAAFYFHSDWIAVLGFVILALIAYVLYRTLLNSVDSVALAKRESLISELTKAA
ncbi:hypothetical protein Acid345_3571 [Candidatus Koribacter versatilis Ellin345]|uniref:ABC-2 type transport system permease protein n=1 Tax=Koribacter versatilis (strain Ellin345) TaxID=204669 RepID=Q1IKM8_KORVE|nr:hypothetical protein [Candidatus Koribacter versatilis]ABF42572.1 hypothetical protein Acid345_3571 [Candidatus Koribacter versatilis Ellin345]